MKSIVLDMSKNSGVSPLTTRRRRRSDTRQQQQQETTKDTAAPVWGECVKQHVKNKRKRGEGMVDEGRVCSTQSTPLPASSSGDLQLNKEVWKAMLTVYSMMRSRNMITTYDSMKEAVEQASRKRFDVSVVHQLEALMPDIVTVERVSGQDKVTLTLGPGGRIEAMNRFEEAMKTRSTTSLPVDNGNVLLMEEDFHPVPPRQQRRLSTSCLLQPSHTPAILNLTDTHDDTLKSMPEQLRRRSMDGIISLSSLEKLQKNEQERDVLSSDKAIAERHARATRASLPDMLQRMRTIYGRTGPKVMGLSVLCDRLKSGGLEMVSLKDIEDRIRCLAEHAPECVHVTSVDNTAHRRIEEEVWFARGQIDYPMILHRLRHLD